ncbi:MAG: carboxypeptidase regulatory-like domain-containing protein [Bacteroidota bacterium]
MKKYHLFTILFLIVILPFNGICAILHVPATFNTIQEGIDASADGDIVMVDPGTYYEQVNMNGKSIILCSNYFTTGNSAFIASTIIDGSNSGRVLTINNYENSSCQVIGFTIQHGNSTVPWTPVETDGGGGIFILDSSPQILHCIIQNNQSSGFGGGLSLYGSLSSAKVMNCTIQNNTANSFGGGVFMGDCSPDAEIVNCIITGNTNTNDNGFNGGGGGVNLYHSGKLENCLITNNSAPYSPVGGGGIQCDWADATNHSALITGCTISRNTALNFGGVSYVIEGGEFRNCIIWGNFDNFGNLSNYDGNSFVYCCTDPLPTGTGNISYDPSFADPALGNFRLTGSPCINTGDNAFSTQPYDLDGNPRIFDGTIDMGAYEYGSTANMTVQIGSGTEITDFFPIYSCYNYNYSQQLYLGSEITSGGGSLGLISKIRFFYSGNSSQFSNWNNWTVYLGNTTKTEFANSSDWVPVSSMTQVFSGIIPLPVDGNWLEITLPTPFYYSGDNVVVAVDENAPGYDCTAQWGSFNSGAPRGLIAYDDNINPDPASPPVANYDPFWDINQVQFSIDPVVGTIAGHVTELPNCTVPILGAIVTTGVTSTTTDSSGYYQLILPVGAYDITVIYHDASQTASSVYISQGNVTIQVFCVNPYYAPPVSLQANVAGTNQNNVHLSWLDPGSVADQYIHWDPGTIYGGLGYNAPMTFSVASRWSVADIAPYGGTYLKKIRFVPADAYAAYTLKVWKGSNASTLLLSQVVTDPIVGGWNDVSLTTPILIDGTQELWFGYEIVETVNGYPAGLGPGPAVAGKGDMINAGYGWFSVKESWGWEFNWTLQGFVSESPAPLAPQQLIPLAQTTSPETILTNPASPSVKPRIIQFAQTAGTKPAINLTMTANALPKLANTAPFAPSSTMTGYNIYRDGVKIGDNIPDLFFDDLALPKGGYNYEVSARYDYGESARIGPVHVDIYTCFPPTNLTVSNSTLTTTTADLSWTPSTVSTNPEWTLEWGPAGFWLGYGDTVHITSTPAYSFVNLTPATDIDVYIRTYCSSSDVSAWVKKTFRTHYFDCPAGSTGEAETCGASTNNGCEMAPAQTGSINCGETVCGTAWLHRTHRDTDWYSFTLTEANDVTLTGNAEFTSSMSIASAPCSTAIFYNSITNSPGYSSTIVARLNGPQVYFVNVAPAYQEQVACDSLDRYWIKLTCNTCLTPTALNATNITSASADLSWTSNATAWNLEWGLAGFIQGSGTMITGTTSNPYHLSGLTIGNSYSYYVQGACGGGKTSYWAGPYYFFLPCPATSLPYAEDFTGQLIGFTPQCWQVQNYGAPSNWILDLNSNAGGVFPQLIFVPSNPNFYSGRSFMTSPVINTTGQASLNLSFKQYINAYSSGTSCEVWTTSDGGMTWSSVWAIAQTGIVGPETKTLSITTPDVGSATFQFAFAVNGNSWDIGAWQIDDIYLTGAPGNGTIQGVVRHCTDATILQGVTVTAGAYTTTTDASGFYQFVNIPVATYNIEFSMAGYVTKTVPGVQVFDASFTTLDTCLILTGPPATRTIQNETVLNGQTVCFDATQTITVAGGGTTFIVQNGGNVNLIAGISIDYLPGAWAKAGSYMHGRIAPTGPFCGVKAATFVTTGPGSEENSIVVEKPNIRVYPNPTNGKFRMELTGNPQRDNFQVMIFGMRGEMVLSETLSGESGHEFSLSDKPAGIYFIKVVAGDNVLTSKLIKTR